MYSTYPVVWTYIGFQIDITWWRISVISLKPQLNTQLDPIGWNKELLIHTSINYWVKCCIEIDTKYCHSRNNTTKYLMWYPWFWVNGRVNPKKKRDTANEKYCNDQWKCPCNTLRFIRNCFMRSDSRAWKVLLLNIFDYMHFKSLLWVRRLNTCFGLDTLAIIAV